MCARGNGVSIHIYESCSALDVQSATAQVLVAIVKVIL